MVESMPSNAWLGFADPLAAIWDSTLATPSPDDLLLCAIRQDDSPPAENRSSRAPRARKNSPYSPPRTTSSASILKRAKVGSKSSCSPDQLQHDISDKENHPVLFNGMGRLVDHDSSPVRQQCETGLKSPPATTTPFSEKISNLLSHRFDVEDDDDEDYMDNQNEEEEEEDDEYDLEDDVEESDHNDDRHSEFTTTTEARYESSEEEQPSESQMDVDDNMAGNDHASHHEDAEDGLVGQDSDESQEDGDEDDPEADEEGNIDEDATTDRTGDDEKLDRRCLPRPELEENSSGIEPEENCSDMDTDCRTGNKAQRAALNRTYQNEHVENDISDSGNRRSCFEKGTRPPGMDSLIWEEVRDFYRDFNTLVENYYILDKIGEGTFSSVYKAVELTHGDWNNSDYCCKPSNPCDMPLVAIKRIYATSSPSRILNEIEILHRLRNSSDITKLIYADRDRDQIIVVLPYYEYTDFRAFFLDLSMDAIKDYMRSLFRAVRDMHEHRIIHRDIKPSNFLFQPEKGIGRLADFGLAQYETTKSDSPTTVRTRYENGRQISYTIPQYELGHPLGGSKYGCLVNDPRPSIKANRAGTRGFRAPEVLFKVVNQTTAIDIWSVGVILLSFFSGQFPFFQSNDDGEGLLEIAHIFGKSNMKKVARHFGKTFETNVPDVGPAQKLKDICMKFNPERASQVGRDGWDLLNRCLDLYPDTRIAAKQALNHPFLSDNPDTEFTFMDELVSDIEGEEVLEPDPPKVPSSQSTAKRKRTHAPIELYDKVRDKPRIPSFQERLLAVAKDESSAQDRKRKPENDENAHRDVSPALAALKNSATAGLHLAKRHSSTLLTNPAVNNRATSHTRTVATSLSANQNTNKTPPRWKPSAELTRQLSAHPASRTKSVALSTKNVKSPMPKRKGGVGTDTVSMIMMGRQPKISVAPVEPSVSTYRERSLKRIDKNLSRLPVPVSKDGSKNSAPLITQSKP